PTISTAGVLRFAVAGAPPDGDLESCGRRQIAGFFKSRLLVEPSHRRYSGPMLARLCTAMSTQDPNLLVGIGAAAGGLPALLEIVDHLSVSYQGAIFFAMHRRPTRHTG